ncbi:FeoB-associated Cys-rich membrane protein [Miniphocaeibacter massiliensis]|nr:FeoB-associated Cys-rich membrane protein [Miniphocaeibacter massiliensis]
MLPTLIILGIIIVAVVFAIIHVKKKGTTCDCGCSSCKINSCSPKGKEK